jgi:hypothetical protein
LGDERAYSTNCDQHWSRNSAYNTNSQGNLQDGATLLLNDDATYIAFVKQFFDFPEQLLTHYLQLFGVGFLFWLRIVVCLCQDRSSPLCLVSLTVQ